MSETPETEGSENEVPENLIPFSPDQAEPPAPPSEPPTKMEKLKNAVGIIYDIQKVRIQTGNRTARHAQPAHLDEKDQAFLAKVSSSFETVEKEGMKELKRLLKGIPVYEQYLSGIRGVGPALSAILISSIDINRADTPSKIWRYCGLAVDNVTGRAERMVKGQRAHHNPWLKAKVMHVLGGCLIKANNPTYKAIYDGRKNRRKNQIVEKCMGCDGTGKRAKVEREVEVELGTKKPRAAAKCWNCDGTGGPAPWGRDDSHRELDARRVMVKMFLADMWRAWRIIEGLPVRPTYAEQYLGRVHNASS